MESHIDSIDKQNGSGNDLRFHLTPLVGDDEIKPAFKVGSHAYPSAERVGDWIFYRHKSYETREVPDDIYLRQGLYADESDPATALVIVRDIGGTFGFGTEPSSTKLGAFSMRKGRDWSPNFFGVIEDDPVEVDANLDANGRVSRRRLVLKNDDPNAGSWVHVDSILWQVARLKAIALTLLAAQGQITSNEAVEQAVECGALDDWVLDDDPPFSGASMLAHALTESLKEWAPGVALVDDVARYGSSLRGFSLHALGARQAYNDWVTSVAIKPCAHCGNWFGKQVGSAKYRSRTKGVIYCSKSCQDAASQAAYRARKKAEREALASRGESDGK